MAEYDRRVLAKRYRALHVMSIIALLILIILYASMAMMAMLAVNRFMSWVVVGIYDALIFIISLPVLYIYAKIRAEKKVVLMKYRGLSRKRKQMAEAAVSAVVVLLGMTVRAYAYQLTDPKLVSVCKFAFNVLFATSIAIFVALFLAIVLGILSLALSNIFHGALTSFTSMMFISMALLVLFYLVAFPLWPIIQIQGNICIIDPDALRKSGPVLIRLLLNIINPQNFFPFLSS